MNALTIQILVSRIKCPEDGTLSCFVLLMLHCRGLRITTVKEEYKDFEVFRMLPALPRILSA